MRSCVHDQLLEDVYNAATEGDVEAVTDIFDFVAALTVVPKKRKPIAIVDIMSETRHCAVMGGDHLDLVMAVRGFGQQLFADYLVTLLKDAALQGRINILKAFLTTKLSASDHRDMACYAALRGHAECFKEIAAVVVEEEEQEREQPLLERWRVHKAVARGGSVPLMTWLAKECKFPLRYEQLLRDSKREVNIKNMRFYTDDFDADEDWQEDGLKVVDFDDEFGFTVPWREDETTVDRTEMIAWLAHAST